MNTDFDLARRRLLLAGAATAAGATLPALSFAAAADEPLITRPVPASGEAFPIVGIGTAVIFDFENDATKFAERRAVIETLIVAWFFALYLWLVVPIKSLWFCLLGEFVLLGLWGFVRKSTDKPERRKP